jgi:hypothetical protein
VILQVILLKIAKFLAMAYILYVKNEEQFYHKLNKRVFFTFQSAKICLSQKFAKKATEVFFIAEFVESNLSTSINIIKEIIDT